MRGDMCPYDHGADPVVVDDVSLPSVLQLNQGQSAMPPLHGHHPPPPPRGPMMPQLVGPVGSAQARSMQVLQQQQLVDLTTRMLDVLDDVIEERLPVGDETRVTTGSESVQKQQYSLERVDPD